MPVQWLSASNEIVGSVKGEMNMPKLSAVMKSTVAEVLNSTRFEQRGFAVKYNDAENPLVSITFPGPPEGEFLINAKESAFSTVERPGVHSDTAETLQRSSFEICVAALKEWAERVIDKQQAWIMDEFGGVADSNPSYLHKEKDHR